MNRDPRPIALAVVNDYPLVVLGIARMLEPDPRVRVRELALDTAPREDVDVVLFDSFGRLDRIAAEVAELRRQAHDARLVVYAWDVDEALARHALAAGADGCLSKRIAGPELADAIVRIRAGERVVEPGTTPPGAEPGAWPGMAEGLTAREAEVVALITQGLTNAEIAAHCLLSINSVKSYIRAAYRKMAVTRRPEAVLWGVEHGMLPPRPQRVPADG